MLNIPTPHNNAKAGDFAKTVLMPGDPLRAKYIAETYLENPRQVNAVRNMFGYTGTYKGKEVSVMGAGMGMPSIGIYSYELFHFYGVENIIRIGTAGGIADLNDAKDFIALGADRLGTSRAVKILNGEADISTMPIEYTDVTKKYNKTICDDLGLTVPDGYEEIEG